MDVPDPARQAGAVSVVASDLHVRYRVPSADLASQSFAPPPVRALRRAMGRPPGVVVRALTGVSFVARSGEAIGVIGRNGSGKSTLMRVVAGLERPLRGGVVASSAPVLLGVNAALLAELSGAQNVHLGCLAMGMTPEATRAAFPGIVDLADLGDAIHFPLKTYSSGMGARLKFAIAVAAKPRILLVDEALATGDAAFRERSEQRIKQLLAAAGTVFLVTHAGKAVEEHCTRAIWLHRGRVVLDGPAYDVAQRYRWWAWTLAKGQEQKAAGLLEDAFAQGHDTQVQLVTSPSTASSTPPRRHSPADDPRVPATTPREAR